MSHAPRKILELLLQEVAEQGNADAIRELLEQGAYADYANDQGGYTALHLASFYGHRDAVEALHPIKKSSDVDTGSLSYNTLGSNVDALTYDGYSALMLASMSGSTVIADTLLEAGADLAVTTYVVPGTHSGFTALHIAAMNGFADVLRVLLESRPHLFSGTSEEAERSYAVVAATTNLGYSALQFAAELGHDDITEQLLLAGCRYQRNSGARVSGWLNAPNIYGLTALHSAVQRLASLTSPQMESQYNAYFGGASADTTTAIAAAERTVLAFLRTRTGSSIAGKEYPARCEAVNIDVTDKTGVTPLHLAAAHGSTKAIELLIRNGAKVNVVSSRVSDQSDSSSTTSSSSNNYSSNEYEDYTRQLYAQQGWLFPIAGSTPLLEATVRNHVDVVRVLLSNGADPRISNKAGETPLQLALKQGFTDIAAALRSTLKEMQQQDCDSVDTAATPAAADVADATPAAAGVNQVAGGCVGDVSSFTHVNYDIDADASADDTTAHNTKPTTAATTAAAVSGGNGNDVDNDVHVNKPTEAILAAQLHTELNTDTTTVSGVHRFAVSDAEVAEDDDSGFIEIEFEHDVINSPERSRNLDDHFESIGKSAGAGTFGTHSQHRQNHHHHHHHNHKRGKNRGATRNVKPRGKQRWKQGKEHVVKNGGRGLDDAQLRKKKKQQQHGRRLEHERQQYHSSDDNDDAASKVSNKRERGGGKAARVYSRKLKALKQEYRRRLQRLHMKLQHQDQHQQQGDKNAAEAIADEEDHDHNNDDDENEWDDCGVDSSSDCGSSDHDHSDAQYSHCSSTSDTATEADSSLHSCGWDDDDDDDDDDDSSDGDHNDSQNEEAVAAGIGGQDENEDAAAQRWRLIAEQYRELVLTYEKRENGDTTTTTSTAAGASIYSTASTSELKLICENIASRSGGGYTAWDKFYLQVTSLLLLVIAIAFVMFVRTKVMA